MKKLEMSQTFSENLNESIIKSHETCSKDEISKSTSFHRCQGEKSEIRLNPEKVAPCDVIQKL